MGRMVDVLHTADLGLHLGRIQLLVKDLEVAALGCVADVFHTTNLGGDLGIVDLLGSRDLEGRSSSGTAGGTGGYCAC